MADDAQLLREYLAGSERAFAELVERHLALIYSSVLRRSGGDAALAQDVTQAVFLLLAQKSRQLCHHPSLAGWLYGTAQYKVAEALRAERRRRIREHTAHLMHQMLTDPHASDWEQIRPTLDEAMLELSGPDREAVLLRYFEGLPLVEIGARLLLTETTAQKRVERALEKLRGKLARRGVTSSAGALAVVLGTQAGVAAPAELASVITTAAAAEGIISVSSGGLLSAITLMTTTQKTIAVAAVAALLATGGALYQRQAARHVTTERNGLENQLASLRRDLQAAVDVSARLEADLERRRHGNTTPVSSPVPTDASTMQSLTAAIEAEQMRLFLATEWAKLAGGPLPLMEKLGLTADQLAQYTAMADRELEGTFPPGPFALNRHQAGLREKWETETRELIGDERFQRLKQLQAAKSSVERIAGYLAYWDHGFTGQQANQMRAGKAGRTQDEFESALRAAAAEAITKMQASIGAAAYDQLQRFQAERSDPVRRTVQSLTHRLMFTNSPLEPWQSEKLMRVLQPRESTILLNEQTRRIPDEVMSEVQSILTPAQIRDWQRVQRVEQLLADASAIAHRFNAAKNASSR